MRKMAKMFYGEVRFFEKGGLRGGMCGWGRVGARNTPGRDYHCFAALAVLRDAIFGKRKRVIIR